MRAEVQTIGGRNSNGQMSDNKFTACSATEVLNETRHDIKCNYVKTYLLDLQRNDGSMRQTCLQ